MIGFLLKKTLFDLLDNALRLALVNAGFIACAAPLIFLPAVFDSVLLQSVIVCASLIIASLYASAAALCVCKISDYGVFNFKDFLNALKRGAKTGLVLGIFLFILLCVFNFVIPFYLLQDSFAGLLLAAAAFWIAFAAICAFQFLLAARARLDTKPGKIIKKCCIMLIDNKLFCLFCFASGVLMLLASIITGFLFPGPAGLLLFYDEAFRLRLLKYKKMENGAMERQKHISWDTLLAADREKTGSRSFRTLFFPWKD
jgi:hypothetical protein